MKYLLTILISIGFWSLTGIFSGLFGTLIPILYFFLGFIFATKSLLLGIGGLIGNLVNIYGVNTYLKEKGSMSNAPLCSKIASIVYGVSFSLTMIMKYIFNYEFSHINYWYFLLFIFAIGITINSFLKKKNLQKLEYFQKSVLRYKIIEKYKDDPKWAIYLYFNNNEEGWNQTIPGSFCAKNPKNDLTFVFQTKEKALNYAQDVFSNANYEK